MTEINKYQNGKIYKIVCNKTNLVYIGSTTQKYLSSRLKGHVFDFKTKRKIITSFKVLENNDYYIELVELYPCNSKDELLVRERYYFDIIECVNKCRPKSTIEEKKEQNNERVNKYRDNNNNKEKITLMNKKYRDNNKEKESIRHQKYHQENKEKIKLYQLNNKDKKKEYDKQYRLKMKEIKKLQII
jgi:hypothetical protein